MAPSATQMQPFWQQGAGIFGVEFVLGGAWQHGMSHGRLKASGLAELQTGWAGHLADAAALDVLELHQRIPLLVGQAGFAEQGAQVLKR